MYHINNKNQALNTSFSHKDLHTDNFTYSEQQILRLLYKTRNDIYRTHTNASIAWQTGCSIRTVIRATNKFHHNGLVIKYRYNQYDPNMYIFNTQSHNTFQSEYVTPKISLKIVSSLILDSYFSNLSLFLTYEGYTDSKTYARPTQPIATDGYRVRDIKNRKIKKDSSKKGNVMEYSTKQMIRQYANDPKMKEYLNTQNVMHMIIGAAIFDLYNLLGLDEEEYYRLTPFPDEALIHAFKKLEPIVTGDRVLKYVIADKMAWVMKLLKDYCKDNNLKPDWVWYYDLCNIVGLDPNVKFKKKPLIVQKTQQQEKTPQKRELSVDEQLRKLKLQLKAKEEHVLLYGGIYGPSLSDTKAIAKFKQHIDELETHGSILPPKILTPEERLESLKLEIQKRESILADFPTNGFGGNGYMQIMLENTKRELVKLECKLKEQYANAKSNQTTSDTMGIS